MAEADTTVQRTLARAPGVLVLTAAVLAGRLASTASRLLGRGSGTAIKGATILRVDRHALEKLLDGKRLALVTGTNGKTTTTHFLAAAIAAGESRGSQAVVHNADGANLHGGVAAALSDQPRASWAVIESDERVVPDLIRIGAPEVLVMLNLARDQMDRHRELQPLARLWRSSLESAGARGPVVVANADDPLIVWAVQTAHRVIWVHTADAEPQDGSQCPQCGSLLIGSDEGTDAATIDDTVAHWRCSDCDLAQPQPTYRAVEGRITDATGHTVEAGLQVPGDFNVGNAACALAAAVEVGIDAATALSGMRTVSSPAGRFSTLRIGDTTVRLFLAKNPTGWAAALPLARTAEVVLAVDAAAADGRDLTWLWDVDAEQLAGRTVVATGRRAADLAVRLAYAGVEHRYEPDLAQALAGPPREVDVIASYTPFQQIRAMGGV